MVPVSDSRTDENEIVEVPPSTWRDLFTAEDWWANWVGGATLAIFVLIVSFKIVPPADVKTFFAKPVEWVDNPIVSLTKLDHHGIALGLGRALLGTLAVFFFFFWAMGTSLVRFVPAFIGLFLLGVIAQVLAQQKVIATYNIEYALWALVLGLAISNTLGTPGWLRPALRTEFYIKTGLVIYGATILLNLLFKLAIPGIFISWVVTPIVLISTYIIGQRWIGVRSKTLNITLSADMSVCGVSAAIATAAACRAKKEELSLAIGISLAFTAIMMVIQPAFIKAVGMDPAIGGAWIGGTIDSTGAVAAAGAVLGEQGEFMAVTIKMIQNMLIGVIAFGVAVYWVTFVETGQKRTVGIGEIWTRFPKFILGFVIASAVFTMLNASSDSWAAVVKGCDPLIKGARDWCFCLAFVSIGLETDFRELSEHLKGGKPILLYVVGQTLNLVLSLGMIWLMFRVFFPDITSMLPGK